MCLGFCVRVCDCEGRGFLRKKPHFQTQSALLCPQAAARASDAAIGMGEEMEYLLLTRKEAMKKGHEVVEQVLFF